MGTIPEWWTEPYPEVTSAKTASAYLDELGASLSRREEDGRFTLATGDQDLITSDTEAELDGFVLGFALSHLIAERHGLIGRRLPHPSEREEATGGGAIVGEAAIDEGGDEGQSAGEEGP